MLLVGVHDGPVRVGCPSRSATHHENPHVDVALPDQQPHREVRGARTQRPEHLQLLLVVVLGGACERQHPASQDKHTTNDFQPKPTNQHTQ